MKPYNFFKSQLLECTKCTEKGFPIQKKPKFEIPHQIIPFDRIFKYSEKEIADSYICFYCQDQCFLKVFQSPSRYTNLFKKAKGLIGFDLSVFEDMNPIIQNEILFKNLALSSYYSALGINVIPNCRPGSEFTEKDYLEAFPKNSIICIGTYGFIKSNKEKENWRTFLRILTNSTKPKLLLVYGPAPKDVFTRQILGKTQVKSYPSFTSLLFKEIKNVSN